METDVVAVRVGAQSEAEGFFAARGGRAQRGTAKRLLAGMGTLEPRDEDRIEDD